MLDLENRGGPGGRAGVPAYIEGELHRIMAKWQRSFQEYILESMAGHL